MLKTTVIFTALERVLKRSHKLDGTNLTVKKYQPPKPIPMYPNMVFVKNLNPETSEDGFRNYMEAKTGENVIDVTYGQEEGTVLVTFKELKGLFYINILLFKNTSETC